MLTLSCSSFNPSCARLLSRRRAVLRGTTRGSSAIRFLINASNRWIFFSSNIIIAILSNRSFRDTLFPQEPSAANIYTNHTTAVLISRVVHPRWQLTSKRVWLLSWCSRTPLKITEQTIPALTEPDSSDTVVITIQAHTDIKIIHMWRNITRSRIKKSMNNMHNHTLPNHTLPNHNTNFSHNVQISLGLYKRYSFGEL